jgi:hypothetical protein
LRREPLAKLPGIAEAVEWAEAATLLVLELKELGGELADGVLGVLHLGDVREGGDDADEIAAGVEMRHRTAEDPKDPVGAWMAEAHDGIANGSMGAKNDIDGALCVGDLPAILSEGDDAKFGWQFAEDRGVPGEFEHLQESGIHVLNAAVRAMEHDGDVEVADEGAETFFTLAEGFDGAALFGEIREGNQDTADISGGAELRDDIQKGPDGIGAPGDAPADEVTANRLAGSNDHGDEAL